MPTIHERHQDAYRSLPAAKLVIGGKDVLSGSGGLHRAIDPTTGVAYGEVPLAGAAEVDRAVEAARRALPDWRDTHPSVRRDLILRLGQLIEANRERFNLIGAIESGIMRHIADYGHIPLVLEWLRYYAGWADKIEGAVVGSSPGQDFGMILREPYGVFAMVIPWNAPLLSLAMKVPAALATGNVMVIKPPEFTPYATILFAELAREAGIPDGVINVIPGGAQAGQALVSDPRIDKISFTGGPQTAKAIQAAAATNMTPGLYELGGKSANIVFPDAHDLDAIAAYSVGYAFTNSGQGCTCPTRLIVHDEVYDTLLEKVVAATAALRVGDPLDAACDMGPVVNAAAMERITGMIARARAENPQALVCGGERLDGELGNGNFLSPGIFAGVRPDSEIASQEIFGPVLSVLRFSSEEEALAIANGTSYALAAYVQTADIRRAHRFVRALRAGGVYVNQTFTMANPANATGGIGQSGYGREGGRPGLDEYLVWKGVSFG
jgi:aldehyde dehydrogenase (NAD+)